MPAVLVVNTVTIQSIQTCVSQKMEVVFMVARKVISGTSVLNLAVKTAFPEIKQCVVMQQETAKMVVFQAGSSPNVISIVPTISHIAWNVKSIIIPQQTQLFSVTDVDRDFIAIFKPVSVNPATTA